MQDTQITFEDVSANRCRVHGRDVRIHHGIHGTPLGPCLVAASSQGICRMELLAGQTAGTARAALAAAWPSAPLIEDPDTTRALVTQAFAATHAGLVPATPAADGTALKLHVRGTPFQLAVWKALLTIPPGQTTTYGELANLAGSPGASRAVGQAVGANPIAWLIPCHRVLRRDGSPGGYRWGMALKLAALQLDKCMLAASGACTHHAAVLPACGFA